MIAIDRSVADVRRPRHRFRRAAQAVRLGLIALARRVIALLSRVCTWRWELRANPKVEPTDLALPIPSSAAPQAPTSYAEMFARLRHPRSKLLDLRAARVVKVSLFEHLVSAWQAPRGTVPQLGILFGYEHWIVLRNAACPSHRMRAPGLRHTALGGMAGRERFDGRRWLGGVDAVDASPPTDERRATRT